MAILSDQKNIWVAASDGDLARVRVLVEQTHLSPNVPDQFTYTPMHAAASYGHLHVLEYLIERGGNVNVTDEDGDTPLYTVENIPTAQFLVRHGATIDHRNHDGISPIEHLREDFPQIAAYLESLLPSNTATTPASSLQPAASSPSQHAQNAASENLTDTLMQRIQDMAQQEGADVDEEALRQAVITTVLEGIAAGFQIQQESSSERPADDTQEEKRMRRE